MNPSLKPLWLAAYLPLFAVSMPAQAQSPAKTSASITKVEIKVIPNLVKFDTVRFDVTAGTSVQLAFSNDCVMPHNLLILKAAAEPSVIAAVNALGLEGMDKGFVPDVPGIVAATKLLQPKQSQVLEFTAPSEAGEYPFVCTFPGHWYTMRGVMRVLAKGAKAGLVVRDNEKVVNVPDALKLSGVTHKPLGTMEKPLVMRSFVPDPDLDPAVFAHHGQAKSAVKYDPTTALDIFEKKLDPATQQMVERPVIIKTQPGIAGAIAVNHGAEFSYVWDTTECRLMYVWRGGFLDLNPYWGKEPGSGRAANYIPWIIGGLVYRASGSAPITGSPSEAPHFGGYRMLQGVPEFWYRLGKRTIRERVIAKAAGGFELQVQSEGDSTPLEWKVSGQDAGAVTVAKEKSGRLTVSFADRPEPSMPEFVPSTGKKKSH
jgi:azurin